MFQENSVIFLNLSEILLWISFSLYSFWSFQNTKKQQENVFKKWFHIIKAKQNPQIFFWISLFFIFNLFTVFFSRDPYLSLLLSFKILEGIILIYLFKQNIVTQKEIFILLILLGIFQGFLSLGQFYFQSNLGLSFLGEPNFNPTTLGTAKMYIGDQTIIRSYGTFLHPNILGAFFVILFFFLDGFGKHYLKYLFLFFLIFTFSRSALIAVFVGLIIKIILLEKEKLLENTNYSHFRKKPKKNFLIFQKILSVLFFFSLILLPLYSFFPERFILGEAFTIRLELIKNSWQIFLAHPWGIGNGNFLFYLQDFVPYILKPWEFQPVHNLYLLILNENGFLGFIFFSSFLFILFRYTHQNNRNFIPLLIAILTLSLFDHYFWDLDQGRQLFWLSLGILLMKNTSSSKLVND